MTNTWSTTINAIQIANQKREKSSFWKCKIRGMVVMVQKNVAKALNLLQKSLAIFLN